ncbi:MAG: hypothetical protein IPM81_18830 [Saprospirales bacterium]|nr:hypothetical protein [Saprospirales bacterium]
MEQFLPVNFQVRYNMTIRKNLCLPLFFLAIRLIAQVAPSGKYVEVGMGLAATNYSGDIAEAHVEFAQANLGGNLFVRYQLLPFVLLRGQLFAGKIAGDDRNSPTHTGRNFRFSTFLLEPSGLLEFALGTYQFDPPSGRGSIFFAPYLFAGLGALFSRARVEYYGDPARRDYFVRTPIPEAGKERHTLLVTPFGGGLRAIFNERLAFALEANARPAHSDILDGVSQNANPAEGDWFYTLGLSCAYILNGPFAVRSRKL